ncbi:UpxY family transcription antiterminator [Tamlana sp. 2_MG-2023]|uniref:UpxY family transcription antiterminator n=1 Tax=unclassified Tamlana TaxID=2614803 RepID=UPI0026E3B552|nr:MULTISPECIES: UpxY family transcription antiterminator [unclassified Tamlana]MDO6760226.1 UpxY family transcription antiterminator [Tamlana sp. 2_MG-2023]MDO6790076.1 UpxY family transcription antiterminator [Tamlana sp. 1_MG-2023]
MDWKVLYVKPRNEKKVATGLSKLGITAYCPTVTEIRQWSDRKKKVEIPLLTSYVLVKVKENEHDLVFQIPGVVRYLFWLGKPAIVKDSDIEVMKNWLSKENTQAQVENIQPGDRIKIKSGLFEGKKALVHEINTNRIQLILLDLDMKITFNRN